MRWSSLTLPGLTLLGWSPAALVAAGLLAGYLALIGLVALTAVYSARPTRRQAALVVLRLLLRRDTAVSGTAAVSPPSTSPPPTGDDVSPAR
jgi:hypothetical protein